MTGDAHFFQDHCPPPVLHRLAPQRSELAERASIQEKQSMHPPTLEIRQCMAQNQYLQRRKAATSAGR